MSKLEGKVAVISGAARGQGRAHAVAMAREGATVVAFDICEPLKTPLHPGATAEQLDETAELVRNEGQECLSAKVDARDLTELEALAERVMSTYGRIDILVINHGIWTIGESTWALDEASWQESIDVNLTGAWKVAKAFVPRIIEGQQGGSVILTASVNGLKAQPCAPAYTAAKHGVVGLMKTLAWELGEHSIRVNAICPGAIATDMTQKGGTVEKSLEYTPRFFSTDRSLLPAGWVPPETVAKTAVFLASDDSEHITGVALPVDAGWTNY
ncbi:mycofactocin-coupled SDR family oxidoreductase [Rhodococcus sp. HM1]|uniref:mycofactocin-coupled SDR family oxidoreductase n=1 Tax=Rhodococcus sp. HM1 TaxID=2937759 RepID=UPI00200B5EE2|nr:mycofactocin-coupled SDR family oxidoreductase [Rhodococcus sp. HM1]MCK8671589.1 mycofactocin-coupled SDR family oxidoreductase [Rhodococcus sp. HM1]